MKRPFLILLIILNLLTANMAAAFIMDEVPTNESHLIQVQDGETLVSCIDESICDHHCHFSSHMTGLISSYVSFSRNDLSASFDIHNDRLYSVDLDLPKRPPQA